MKKKKPADAEAMAWRGKLNKDKILVSAEMTDDSGFTVVEMIVATGLFLVIISVAMGSYVRILRTQGLMTDLMAANDNVSLVLEQMARDIRTGKNFPVGEDLIELPFKNDKGQCVRYSYKEGVNEKYITKAVKKVAEVDCSVPGIIYDTEERLTSESVVIEGVIFKVEKRANDGGVVFDRIEIDITVNTIDEFFDEGNIIKTVVSARKYF